MAQEDQLNENTADKNALEKDKNSINNYLKFLRPINLTAENSAIHYNESPYNYVLDNPISYVDPFGLDSLKPFIMVGHKHTSNNSLGTPWWLGPALIAASTRFEFLKPVAALGSDKGSSFASKYLAKLIPAKFTKVLGTKLGSQVAKKVGTNVIGRGLGRFVPYVGVALTIWDYQTITTKYIMNNTPESQKETMLNALGTAF